MRPSGLAAAVFLMACSTTVRHAVGPSAPAARVSSVRVQVVERAGRTIRTVSLEDYVRGTVLGEFTTAAEDREVVARMLELQAIVSRTYAAAHAGRHRDEGFDVCATTHCQIYEPDRLRTSRWSEVAIQAVTRTRGLMIWYGARPVEALFHADCGGHTANASDVWRGPGSPYLLGRRDPGVTHSTWEYVVRLADLQDALRRDPLTRFVVPLRDVQIVSRDASGRAREIRLRGVRDQVLTGEEFRRLVTARLGAYSIRSTLFDLRRDAEVFTFSGRGFGHGVGLCQTGALARLREGLGVEAVLKHYFPGTSVRQITAPRS